MQTLTALWFQGPTDKTLKTELLPSSDEVDKRVFWLHFERQQSHLDNGEWKVRNKSEGEKKSKIAKEREQRQKISEKLMTNTIHLLFWHMPTDMSHVNETCDFIWWNTVWQVLPSLNWHISSSCLSF